MEKLELEKKDTINLVIKQEEDNGERISLKNIFNILLSCKRFIVMFTCVTFILSILAVSVYMLFIQQSSGSVQALISFNFDGIDKGLDPHGKTFDIDKLKAPVVVDKVMDTMNLYGRKLTTEDIRKNIDIQGVIPDDVINKILTINKMAEKDVTKLEELNELEYHPTQFMVTFKNEKKLGLDGDEANKVVNELLKEYKNYFIETYGDKNVLSIAVGELNYDEYDYPEVARIMKGQIDIITSYISDKKKVSPDFRSKTTQMSFGDIVSYLNIINDVDISRMNSLIYSYNLTKDKDRLLSLYQYRIEQYQLEMGKKQDEAQMAQAAVKAYQKDKNLIMMPGSNGETAGTTEFDQKNEYYDQLLGRSVDAGVTASEDAREIEYYTKILEKINGTVVDEILRQKYSKEVDSMVVSISKKMNNWVDITNKTVEEYFETEVFNNAVKIPVPAQYKSSFISNVKIPALAVIVLTILAAFTAVVLVLLKNAVSGPDNNKTATGEQQAG
jgi:hypothetical protein